MNASHLVVISGNDSSLPLVRPRIPPSPSLIASTLNSLPGNTASAITAFSGLSTSAHHLSPAIESHAARRSASLRINRTPALPAPVTGLTTMGAPAMAFRNATTSSRPRHRRHGCWGTPWRSSA